MRDEILQFTPVLGHEGVEFLVASTEHRRSDYSYNITHVDAFEQGGVGWAAVEATAEFQATEAKTDLSYEPVPLRVTAVLVLRDGVWKIIQWHFATPIPDDPAVTGPDLPHALDMLTKGFE